MPQGGIEIKLTGEQLKEFNTSKQEDGLQALAREIITLIDEQFNDRSQHTKDTDTYRRQYHDTELRGGDGLGPWKNSAKVHTPLTLNSVDTIHAHAMRVCTGIEPYVKVSTRPSSASNKGREIEELLHQQLKLDANFRHKFDLLLKDALIDGTAIAKVYWNYEMRRVKDLRAVDEALIEELGVWDEYEKAARDGEEFILAKDGEDYRLGDRIEVRQEEITKDYPDFDRIRVEDFAIYPITVHDIDEAVMVGHRVFKTKNDLLIGANSGMYDNDAVKKLVENPSQFGGDEESRVRTDSMEEAGIDGVNNHSFTKHIPYEIWECIYQWDADGDGIEEDCLFTLDRNTGIIIRAVPYPHYHGLRHFVEYRPYPRSDMFFGKSLCEVLKGLQDQDDAITNQGLNAGNLATSPFITELDGSPSNLAATGIRIGQVNRVREHDDIQIHRFDIPTQQNFSDKQTVRQMAEMASGVNDASAGVSSSKARPLGETMAVLEQAGYKFQVIIGRVQDSNASLFHQIVLLDYQYLSPESEQRITGKETRVFDGLTLMDVAAHLIVSAHGNTLNTNREQEMVAAEKMVIRAERSPNMQSQARQWAVDRDFLLAHGKRNFEEMIGTEEEAKQADAEPKGPPPVEPPKLSLDPVTSLAVYSQQNPEIMEVIQAIAPVAQALGLVEGEQGQAEAAQREIESAEQEAMHGIQMEKNEVEFEKQKALQALTMQELKLQMATEKAKASLQLMAQKIQAQKAQADAAKAKPSANGAGKTPSRKS